MKWRLPKMAQTWRDMDDLTARVLPNITNAKGALPTWTGD